MTLANVQLDSRFATELPELAVPWKAAEVPNPELLVLNEPLAQELGLDPDWLRTGQGLAFLTGTSLPDGAKPVAQAYAGHQFGGYTPRLGDGRALLLGELTTVNGGTRDLHLKGSGPTPFSRGGDGFAAVGPMLREYLVSEFMHAVGIPTTRSLAVVATGRPIRRETGMLPGALLVRTASSHLRVGTFEYVRATGDNGLLKRVADFAIARHYPDVTEPIELFAKVVDAQAKLIAQWMLVAFVHGVMNTDNMTISGETIDYGPCAFMETYDPKTVFSSIDHHGRYAYGNQPVVGEWNLARLAEAMLPLFADDEDEAVARATDALRAYRPAYAKAFTSGMRAKLGLSADAPDDLISDLLPLLHQQRIDHTSFYRALADGTARDLFLDRDAFDGWEARWQAVGIDISASRRANPVYVPRNHLVEEALASGAIESLLGALTRPFDEKTEFERFAEASADSGGYQTFCGT